MHLINIHIQLKNNFKTDLIGLINSGDKMTNNCLNDNDPNNFLNINQLLEMNRVNKSLISFIDELNLKPSVSIDPLDSLIVGLKSLEFKIGNKKTWSKELIFITDGYNITTNDNLTDVISKLNNENFHLTILLLNDSFDEIREENKLFYKNFESNVKQFRLSKLSTFFDNLKEPISHKIKSSQLNFNINFGNFISIPLKYTKSIGKPPSSLTLKNLKQDLNPISKLSSKSNYYFDVDDKSTAVDDHSKLIKAYNYGSILIPEPPESEGGFLKLESLIGFDFLHSIPISTFDRNLVIGEPSYLYADPKNNMSQLAFSSIVKSLASNDLAAVVRFVRKDNERPLLGVCFPVSTSSIDYLQFVRVPFADQMRHFSFPSLDRVVTVSGHTLRDHKLLPNDKMCGLMDEFVASMDLTNNSHQENSDVKYSPSDDWFNLEDNLCPSIHRINEIVLHGAFTGNLNKDNLSEPHKNITKYFNPPEFALKRSHDPLENCKSLFELKEHTKRTKRSKFDTNDEPSQVQTLDIDELLGKSENTDNDESTISNDGSKNKKEDYQQHQQQKKDNPSIVWDSIKNNDDSNYVYDTMCESIKNSTDHSSTLNGLKLLRNYAVKVSVVLWILFIVSSNNYFLLYFRTTLLKIIMSN